MISIAANSVANGCERNAQKQRAKMKNKKNKPLATVRGKLSLPTSTSLHKPFRTRAGNSRENCPSTEGPSAPPAGKYTRVYTSRSK